MLLVNAYCNNLVMCRLTRIFLNISFTVYIEILVTLWVTYDEL